MIMKSSSLRQSHLGQFCKTLTMAAYELGLLKAGRAFSCGQKTAKILISSTQVISTSSYFFQKKNPVGISDRVFRGGIKGGYYYPPPGPPPPPGMFCWLPPKRSVGIAPIVPKICSRTLSSRPRVGVFLSE